MALVLVVGVAACLGASTRPPLAVDVTVTSAPGETLGYEPAELTIRADGPIAITFQNGSSLAHNLVFTGALKVGTRTIVDPGMSDRLVIGAISPGEYAFACTIHDGMKGRLIVIDEAAAVR